MISFIFMVDGPCSINSWKYDEFINDELENENQISINMTMDTRNSNIIDDIKTTINCGKYDRSQWWSRRDAMCRIINASIWKSKHLPYDSIIDSCVLFENQMDLIRSMHISENYCRPVLIHHASEIYDDIYSCRSRRTHALLIENVLIKQWKDSFVNCERLEYANVSRLLEDDNNSNSDGKNEIRKGLGQLRVVTLNRSKSDLDKIKHFNCKLDTNDRSIDDADGFITCSYEPWKEMQLIDNYINKVIDGSNKNDNINQTCSRNGMDKREMLSILQKECSIEFLRAHSLNGSEKTILKKLNRDEINKIYVLWNKQQQQKVRVDRQEYNKLFVANEGCYGHHLKQHNHNHRGNDGGKAIDNHQSTCSNDEYSKLRDSFKAILIGMIVRAKRSIRKRNNWKINPTAMAGQQKNNDVDSGGDDNNADYCHCDSDVPFRTTLLLLHEDYPYELPVFGVDSNGSVGVPSIGVDHHGGRGSSNHLPIPDFVICFMGAVRDASKEEERAVMEAASLLNIDCIGANLGRTAEFTSKIVISLMGHTLANQLHKAVALLILRYQNDKRISSNSHGSNDCNNNDINVHARPKRAVIIDDTITTSANNSANTSIEKLTPHRQGEWTWDGYRNRHNKPAEHSKKRKYSSDNNKLYSPEIILDQDISLSSHDALQQNYHMYIIAWLALSPEEISIQMNRKTREKMHGIIQLIVCTLWRSRVGSEVASSSSASSLPRSGISNVDISNAESRSNNNNVACHSNSSNVFPTLLLIFRNGFTLRLTQNRLSVAMANLHMAAPSEYQVLLMLQQLISQDIKAHSNNYSSLDSVLTYCLQHILPQSLTKKEKKKIRIMTLKEIENGFGFEGCINSNINNLHGINSNSDDENPFSYFAYQRECHCCSSSQTQIESNNATRTGNNLKQKDYHVIALFSPPAFYDGSNVTSHDKFDDIIDGNLYNYIYRKYNDKGTNDEAAILPLLSASSSSKKLTHRKKMKVHAMTYHGRLYQSSGISPQHAVTMLQHYAYHGVLYSAVNDAIACLNTK